MKFFFSKGKFPLASLDSPPPLREDVGGFVLVVDLKTSSINDLQDSYLWDWVWREFGRIAKRRGMATEGEVHLLFWMKASVTSFEQPGGALELVNWILGEACR